MQPEHGHRIVAAIADVKGTCRAGHHAGDLLPVSARNTGGLCGYLYHAAFPYILMLQFGGSFPWGDPNRIELRCPDKENMVTVDLRRVE